MFLLRNINRRTATIYMPISTVERGKHIFKELLKKTTFKTEVT